MNTELVKCIKLNKTLQAVQSTTFEEGKVYRHIAITEGKETQHMVYGVVFDEDNYNECFVDYAIEIQKKMADTGLVENGKVISKSKFAKEYASVHIFGRQGKKIVSIGKPKDSMFLCYFKQGATKKDAIDIAYRQFVDIYEGYIHSFNYMSHENGFVRWTDRGTPLGF